MEKEMLPHMKDLAKRLGIADPSLETNIPMAVVIGNIVERLYALEQKAMAS